MSLNLPKTTDVNRFIAKTHFYKQPGITPKLRDLINQQIERITWTAKVAPSTMDAISHDMDEFHVLTIELTTSECDNAVLVFLQKTIPYPILFVLRSSKGSRISAVLNVKNRTVLSSEWLPQLALQPSGDTIDSLYMNYLLQISDDFARAGGDVGKYTEAMKLKRTINALKVKAMNEMQIHKRQSLARERYDLELRLKELLR